MSAELFPGPISKAINTHGVGKALSVVRFNQLQVLRENQEPQLHFFLTPIALSVPVGEAGEGERLTTGADDFDDGGLEFMKNVRYDSCDGVLLVEGG